MTAGLLEVAGTLDTNQFWPSGRSDADTATVIVSVTAGAIKFRKNDSAPFQTTHAFDNATVKGRVRKAAIRNGKITIRLQGIDAPELHYQPSPLTPNEKKGLSAAKIAAYHDVNHFYRQPMGATTTKALHDFLTSSGNPSFQCRVFTQIDQPSEAFDTYGRLVADIEITHGGKPIDLNDWLVENGWAFPTFYSSMTNNEINKLLLLTKAARDKKRGVWKFLSKTIGPFDFTLLEPKKNEIAVLTHDNGPVLFPKIYRRYTNWSARHKAKTTAQSFQNFLAAGSNGKPDDCFETKDFLANGVHSATHRRLDEFIQAGKKINFAPDELVFSEAPSKLVGPDGKDILSF